MRTGHHPPLSTPSLYCNLVDFSKTDVQHYSCLYIRTTQLCHTNTYISVQVNEADFYNLYVPYRTRIPELYNFDSPTT